MDSSDTCRSAAGCATKLVWCRHIALVAPIETSMRPMIRSTMSAFIYTNLLCSLAVPAHIASALRESACSQVCVLEAIGESL